MNIDEKQEKKMWREDRNKKKKIKGLYVCWGVTEIVEEIIRQARKREKTNILISKEKSAPDRNMILSRVNALYLFKYIEN